MHKKITYFILLTATVCLIQAFIYPQAPTTKEPSAIEEIYNLDYYTGKDQDINKHKLNLFLPKGVENPPMLLWIHGGAWAFGDRKNETELARKFAAEGIAVAAISYRLSPGVWQDPKYDTGIQHPEHIRDVARAFDWLHKKAKDYGYDPHSIFVSGYSAGGHLSALLAMAPTYLTEVGRSVRDIKAAIPIAGAYDMEAYYKTHLTYNGKDMAEQHVKAALGNTMQALRAASPTKYIDNQWIPMLVISESDTYDYTVVLEEAARKANYQTMEFFHVKDLNHGGFYRDLAFAEKSDYRDKIVEYIHQNKVDYQYLPIKDGKLAYKIFGKGEPLFLLNGGPGFSSQHFHPLATKLAEKYQVILFDQRGTGYSSLSANNAQTIKMDLMVDDMEQLRQHLGFEEITLMGHSFGGMLAMSYAAKHPKPVKKMILSHSGGMNLEYIFSSTRRMQSRLNEEELTQLNELSSIDNPDLRTLNIAKASAAGYVFDRSHRNVVFQGLAFKARFYQPINQLVWQDLRRNNYDLSSALKSFAAPVLIIQGDSDIVPPAEGEHSHSIFPNSKLIFLKDCVHYGWIEHPEKYFGAINNFLSS